MLHVCRTVRHHWQVYDINSHGQLLASSSTWLCACHVLFLIHLHDPRSSTTLSSQGKNCSQTNTTQAVNRYPRTSRLPIQFLVIHVSVPIASATIAEQFTIAELDSEHLGSQPRVSNEQAESIFAPGGGRAIDFSVTVMERCR